MKIRFMSVLLFVCVSAVSPAVDAKVVITKWSGDAETVYDAGFTRMLMRHPEGGVCLFNMELIQNDAPGAGYSEKGISWDPIWGPNRARKILALDDPRTYKAWLVIFAYRNVSEHTTSRGWGKAPLYFTVNGHDAVAFDMKGCTGQFHWAEFPAEWLKKGDNVIELFSPGAKTPEEGGQLFLARADEFAEGGGDPANVGKTSFKSTDGGETWKESPFGPLGNTRAEYVVRLSLDRYVKTGWLATPVIDLWKADYEDFIVANKSLTKFVKTKHWLKVSVRGETPEGTSIEYFMRKSSDPNPYSDKWSPYEFIGSGPDFHVEFPGEKIQNRYIQVKAVLSTSDPLKTPVVKSFDVQAKVSEFLPVPGNMKVVEIDNEPIKYSSIRWEWEPWDRPEFAEIRLRENLDEQIEGCRTQFEAQVRILGYATRRFNYSYPIVDFPGWDAKSILERVDKLGTGGMCIQYNNLLMGLLLAYGWQTRLMTIPGHEVCEVWSDDFGKWIYMDASYLNHYIYDRETLIPQNILELHNNYLKVFPPDGPVDWLTFGNLKEFDNLKLPTARGSLTHHADVRVNTAAERPLWIRTVPRNNFYEKPYPRPLTHGNTFWPWDGYINWYDEMCPPMRQYSQHTDRPRDLYPDLNRVYIRANSAFGVDRIYLHFETYTPNFSHVEVDVDGTGWKRVGIKYTWYLRSGVNTLKARAVSKAGVRGKPSSVVLRYVDVPQRLYKKIF